MPETEGERFAYQPRGKEAAIQNHQNGANPNGADNPPARDHQPERRHRDYSFGEQSLGVALVLAEPKKKHAGTELGHYRENVTDQQDRQQWRCLGRAGGTDPKAKELVPVDPQ